MLLYLSFQAFLIEKVPSLHLIGTPNARKQAHTKLFSLKHLTY